MMDADDLARRIDVLLRADERVAQLYSARPLLSRAVRAAAGADVPLALVQVGESTTITVSVGVSKEAGARVAAQLAESIRALPGAEEADVRVRVSRILPATE